MLPLFPAESQRSRTAGHRRRRWPHQLLELHDHQETRRPRKSPFNPNGNAGKHYAGNPGTASLQHSNSPHSISEYDIACFQHTVHGH